MFNLLVTFAFSAVGGIDIGTTAISSIIGTSSIVIFIITEAIARNPDLQK